jgi:type I restriction enzyme R subunit
MDAKLLYESPFTDIAPQGPDQVFDEGRVTQLFRKIEELNEAFAAA